MSKPRILAVCGPTASGKTALAIELARRHNGEIISCDSMQIYRGMDIGTAKPTEEEKCGIPHHLIDIVDPCEPFSAADYAPLAKAAAADILARGKLPIFCGGTGLYLDAVLTETDYADADTDPALRASLLDDAEKYGPDALWQRLYAVDPDAAAAIHKNNVKRVARALEIYLTSGVTKTEWDARSRLRESPYDAVILALDRPREALYARIDERVDAMVREGLFTEVETLLRQGLNPESCAMQAIGYKEVVEALSGKCSAEQAVDAIKQNSRRYAKRQLTWLRRDTGAQRIAWDGVPDLPAAAQALAALWRDGALSP